MPDEFDAEATELLWQRVLAFAPFTGYVQGADRRDRPKGEPDAR